MKKVVITTVGVLLAGLAVGAMASKQDRENLAQCTSSIEALYGEDARTKLKGVKNSRSGSTMRIKTIPAEGESLLVSCLVDREGGITLTDSDGVALTDPAYDTADKVSLND
jgi:hypothetical protein